MIQVSIPVHPLTLRVLRAEYGTGPIVMSNHDPLFTFITCSPLRHRQTKSSDVLSTEVTFQVDDRLAMHLQQYDWQVGSALLKLHKMELCKFAASAVMLGFKGGAKAGLYVWLMSNEVPEDEYSLETAYKLWQRYGWKICDEKNSTFSIQMRGKAAKLLYKKKLHKLQNNKQLQKKASSFTDNQIELISMSFSHSLLLRFRRPSKNMAKSARLYYYAKYSGLSYRQLGQKLGIHWTSILYAEKSIARQAKLNITLRRLLVEALPGKHSLPVTSLHDSTAACIGKEMHSDTGFAQAPGTDRPRRSGIAA